MSVIDWRGSRTRQREHYARLSSHLQARGLAVLLRPTIAVIAAGLSLDAIATIWTPTGPRGPAQVGCAIAAGVGAAAATLIWAFSWPNLRMALLFVVLSDVSIALVALAQHDPVVAMFTCTTFAMMASYTAIFHTAPVMVFNFVVAGMTGVVAGLRIAQAYSILGAVSAFMVLLLLNLAVPFAIQIVVHLLGADAVLAERDQLTGLFTRGAFHRRAKAHLEQGSQEHAYVVVYVIDLDRFKQLNDSYGHSTGDDALVSVARALRDTTDDSAVIGRSGGEEFVIADIWHPDEVNRRAQQLCDAIAALPFGITASIGTAGVHPAYRTGNRSDLLIELIAAADAAMYAAKRRGGNQAGHHEWPLASFADDETDYRDGVSA